MPRILITGAAGFLGSHLCDRFIREGYEVVAMDNLITGSLDNIESYFGRDGFTFVQHDVTNFIHIPGELDFILHFALTAPFAFGRKLTDWQMVHDNVAWFGGIAASDVYVERRENDADEVGVMMPEATTCGEDFVATITMRNTGNLAWDAERGYGLRARDNDDAFSTAGTWIPRSSDSCLSG